jgi:hypothetical protein
MMTETFAQGGLLLERVPRTAAENVEGVAMAPAEGEAGGHRHAIRERVIMFRDDSLARFRDRYLRSHPGHF